MPRAVVPYDPFRAINSDTVALLSDLPFINVADSPYNVATGNSAAANAAGIALAYAALPAAGGELRFPAGTFDTNASLAPKTNVTISGSGGGILPATVINYTGTGFWIDSPALTKVDGFALYELGITVGSGGLGAIRIGSTSQIYDSSKFCVGWHFNNLNIVGPGPSISGLVGVSLTQLEQGTFENIRVVNFEAGWINATSSANDYSNITVTGFLYGWAWTQCSGTTGGAQDTATLLNIVGPMVGAAGLGYNVKVDNQNIRTLGCFFETLTAGVVSKAFIWFTDKGRNFVDIGSLYSVSAGTVNNTLVFDSGSLRNSFIGALAGQSSMPSMSIGTFGVGPPTGDNRHQFIACSDYFNAAVPSASDGATAVIVGNAPGYFASFTPTITPSAGTWTGQVVNVARWALVGRTMTLTIDVSGTLSVGASLALTIPNGYKLTNNHNQPIRINDGTYSFGIAASAAGASALTLYRDVAASLFNAATVSLLGTFEFEVNK